MLFGPNGEPRSKPYVEIYDLDKNKEYEMATIAVNGEGPSVQSDIEIVKPGEGVARKYFSKAVCHLYLASTMSLWVELIDRAFQYRWC